MEDRASELLRRALSKVHRQDLFMLNEDTLRPVIWTKLAAWIQKAEREMLPPWIGRERSSQRAFQLE